MTRRIALVLVAALALAATAEPASAKRARCAVKASKTVAKNHLVRLYTVRNGDGGRTLSGCRRSNGRKTTLAKGYDDGYVLMGAYRDVRLAGRFAAFAFDATDISCKAGCPPDYDPTTTTVVVSDVRARRKRTAVVDATPGSLRLSKQGVAAWLAPLPGGAELRALDAAGLGRVVDSGAIDAASLALRGLQLGWTNAGVAKTADLTPF